MAAATNQIEEVDVAFVKSAVFRTIHVDGCFGGPSSKGHVHMAVYSERAALPKTSRLSIRNGGAQIDETINQLPKHLERELEADLILDLGTAVSVGNWLIAQADNIRKQLNMPDAVWAQMSAVGK